MGGKHSSGKCTQTTIDYIRNKDVQRLNRQLSKRPVSCLPMKKLSQREENRSDLLRLDAESDEQQRSALHFAAIEGRKRGDFGRREMNSSGGFPQVTQQSSSHSTNTCTPSMSMIFFLERRCITRRSLATKKRSPLFFSAIRMSIE